MSDPNPEPQPISDIEKIRQKRLAKLQQLEQARKEEEQASGSSTGTATPKQTPKPTPSASTPVSKPATPAVQPAASNSTSTSLKRPSETTLVAPTPTRTPKPQLSPEEAAAQWEDRTLCHIFRVSLDPNPKAGEHYLESLRKDLDEQDAPARLTVGMLDSVVMALGPELQSKFIPADYLLGAWRRAAALQRGLRDQKPDPSKQDMLKEVRSLCIRYLGLCFTVPELFESCSQSAPLSKYLLLDPENNYGMTVELLNDLAAHLESQAEEGDSALEEVFACALEEMRAKLSEMDISMDYKPYLDAFVRISTVKTLGAILCKQPSYVGAGCTAANIETNSMLGPLLRLSPVQSGAFMKFFGMGNLSTRGGYVVETTRALRLTATNIRNSLFELLNNLIRISAETRNRTLDFFARAVNLNHKRRAIHVDPKEVATEAFFINVSLLLSRFCEPFIDVNLTKLGKAEVEYFRRNPRVDISDETKLNADEATAKAFYEEKLDGTSNFITEIFFITAAANYYGILSAQNRHDELYRELSDLEKHVERIKEAITRMKIANNPLSAIYTRNLQKVEERITKGHAFRLSLEVILWDMAVQPTLLNYSRYLSSWLLRLVSPDRSYPTKPISLPLPSEPPMEFSCLPEYFLEIVGDTYAFAARNFPSMIFNVNELVTFSIVFLRMTSYVKNPQQKARLVELINYGVQPMRGKPTGIMGEALNRYQFALDHLLNALMNFYIDIESQYYHKFSVRYYISEIIQKIWPNKAYRQKLEQESKLNEQFFVKFVALLLNDVTLVMDNSLTALADIHRLQDELTPERAANLPQQELQEKEAALAKASREASQYTNLSNETIKMLSLFTAAIPKAFVKKELVHRLAGMLNYNLDALVGPKSSKLKVRNPEQYHFRPRMTLAELSDVYLNLHDDSEFISAIAQDGRSYKPENFESLYRILSKFALKSRPELDKIKYFAKVVEETKRALDEGEEELGEIPDEFLDPILATLMEDPVILPTSKNTLDRNSIAAILLSDGKDPFNRQPLTMDQVIPNTELKARIDAFVAQRRAERAQKRVTEDLNQGKAAEFGTHGTEGIAESEVAEGAESGQQGSDAMDIDG